MVDKKIVRDVTNIIEGLGRNENPETISILEDVGTNSKIDAIREMTSRALVKKNMHDSLNIVISNKGKGINDMSTVVAMSTINELLSLNDKTEAIKILEDTVENHSDEEVRDNARSVKALMAPLLAWLKSQWHSTTYITPRTTELFGMWATRHTDIRY